jgi:dihydroflavonol-4-reductase
VARVATVLVTGATGFIGSHVVRALLARGDDVRALVRTTSRTAELESLPVRLVNGDINDRGAVRRALRGADCACPPRSCSGSTRSARAR